MANPKISSLSVFFPCYNEESNVKKTIIAALKLLPQICKDYEIIIVDDGSSDGTKNRVKKLQNKYPDKIKLFSHKVNLGYGAALKTGFKESKKDWIFFTDGDGQFNMSELKLFLPHTSSFDVIIGYRKKRAEGFKRWLNAHLFKIAVQSLFNIKVTDIDCAFKLIKRSALKNISLSSDGAMISSELLYKLKKNGYQWKEIGVNHYLRLSGKATGSNIKVIIKAFIELFSLFWNERLLKKRRYA